MGLVTHPPRITKTPTQPSTDQSRSQRPNAKHILVVTSHRVNKPCSTELNRLLRNSELQMPLRFGWFGRKTQGLGIVLAPKGGGGGGGLAHCHGVLFSSTAGGAYWLIAIRCPSLEPFPSIGGGAHWPLTNLRPSSSSLPIFPSYFPCLSLVVPTEPPDFCCFTALCRVHVEEGNGPCCWPRHGGGGGAPTQKCA